MKPSLVWFENHDEWSCEHVQLPTEFGGGGHHNAAGAQLQGDLDSVRSIVFQRVDQLLDGCN